MPAAIEEGSGVSGTLLETCQILRAHSRADALLAPRKTHLLRLERRLSPALPVGSLIGNGQYSKTIIQSPSSTGEPPYKIIRNILARPHRSHRLFRKSVHTCFCDLVIEGPPQSAFSQPSLTSSTWLCASAFAWAAFPGSTDSFRDKPT